MPVGERYLPWFVLHFVGFSGEILVPFPRSLLIRFVEWSWAQHGMPVSSLGWFRESLSRGERPEASREYSSAAFGHESGSCSGDLPSAHVGRLVFPLVTEPDRDSSVTLVLLSLSTIVFICS